MAKIDDGKTTRQIQKPVAVDIQNIAGRSPFKKNRVRVAHKGQLRTFKALERLAQFLRLGTRDGFRSYLGERVLWKVFFLLPLERKRKEPGFFNAELQEIFPRRARPCSRCRPRSRPDGICNPGRRRRQKHREHSSRWHHFGPSHNLSHPTLLGL